MILWIWMACSSLECSLEIDIVGDGIDQNCDGIDGIDNDGDGQASKASGGVDCDDNDIASQSEWFLLDFDQDGWGNDEQELWLCLEDIQQGLSSNNLVKNGGDCNDQLSTVFPTAEEVCDQMDNDCDGLIDQEDSDLDSTTTIRLYRDADGDGLGDLDNSSLFCEDSEEWVLNNRDCDDTDNDQNCWDEECLFGLCDLSIELNNVQLDFAFIPAGIGIIGSPPTEAGHEPEENQVELQMSEFWMLTTPVTQELFSTISGRTPSMFQESPLCNGQCPVESVSWHEAAQFCNNLTELLNDLDRQPCYSCLNGQCLPVEDTSTCRGIRLPNEAEWEYAARAGTVTPFWTSNGGGDLNNLFISNAGCGREWTLEDGTFLDHFGWFCSNNIGDDGDPLYGTKPVAWRQPNGWGLFDMVGGIWEMTNDQYIETRVASDNPFYPITNEQVQSAVRKGGMWGDPPSDLRAARREPVPLDYQNGDVGFRIVMLP